MSAKKVRHIIAAAAVAGAVGLSGCGGGNVNAVQQNDSVIQSVTEATASTVSIADTDSEADVIAPQVIQPNAITPAAESEASSAAESTAESIAESTAPTESEAESSAYTTAGINLRAEASGSADVVNTIEPGEEITVLGSTDGSWTHIRYNGEEGYIASKYITTDAETARDAKANYYDDDDDYDYDYSYEEESEYDE